MKDFLQASLAFLKLTDLQLNGTMITWQEIQEVIVVMPNLRLLEIGYNHLTYLSLADHPLAPAQSSIQAINLDSNECHGWSHICQTFHRYSV